MSPSAPRASAPDTSSAREQYRRGLAFERGHKPNAASAAYRRALSLDPEIPEAHYRLGRLLAESGQVMLAVDHLYQELKLNPRHFDASRELGLGLARLDKSDRAITELEALTRRQPGNDENWRALGFAYSIAGKTKEAEEALRRAARQPPERAVEHRDLGVLLASLGREDEARKEYARGMALDRRDPTIWINLGNLDRRAGQLERALADYREAEKRDTTFGDAMNGQVQVLIELGRPTEAGATYRRWLHRRPGDHAARMESVKLYQSIGRDDVALELGREGVRRFGRSGDAHIILAKALEAQGEYREGMRELRKAQKLFKDPLNSTRIKNLIDQMMGSAPDSLRAMLKADTLDVNRR